MKIVIIRDIKANSYGNPIFVASLGGAIRSFGDEVNKTDGNPIAQHPGDFELYYAGDYEPEDGSFTLRDKMEQIALASNFSTK